MGVNREPVAKEGNGVTKIKAAGTLAGIGRRRFVFDAADAEIAAKQPVDRERQAGATKNDRAAEAEFQIARGLEGHFFAVEKRGRGSLMFLERGEGHDPAERAEKAKK